MSALPRLVVSAFHAHPGTAPEKKKRVARKIHPRTLFFVLARDSHDLLQKLKDIPLATPPAVIVSGTDATVFDQVEEHLRRVTLKHETVEVTVLTGEPDDARLLLLSIFNIPLFSPYRLFIIKNAAPLFKDITQNARDAYQLDFARLPDRTLLAMFYEGEIPKGILKLFGDNVLHLQTKSLYAENIEEAIRRSASQLRLALSEDAIQEIRERVAPREGAIHEALRRIKEEHGKEHPVTFDEVREILFPRAGWDMFRLADACFAGDVQTFTREIVKYSTPEDSILALLKQLLNRADELRRYQICRAQNLGSEETIQAIGLGKRHPFIQKKALRRLQDESLRFGSDRMLHLYDMLVDTSVSFRLNVPADQQSGFFQERALHAFFWDAKVAR